MGRRSQRVPASLLLGLAALGCVAAGGGAVLRWKNPRRGPHLAVGAAESGIGTSSDRRIAARFSALVAEKPDLTYADLAARLDLAHARAPEAGPSFDPTGADYWKQI